MDASAFFISMGTYIFAHTSVCAENLWKIIICIYKQNKLLKTNEDIDFF